MLPVDINKVNQVVENRVKDLPSELKASQAQLGIVHGPDGFDKIKTATKKRDGLIYRISVRFKKTGVYSEKGAGRGYGGTKGSKWLDANGNLKSTNPKSLGKQGTGRRKAKPWYNPVIEKFADDLANKVADEFVEVVFNNLKI